MLKVCFAVSVPSLVVKVCVPAGRIYTPAYCNMSVIQCPTYCQPYSIQFCLHLSRVSQQSLDLILDAILPRFWCFPKFAPKAQVSGGASAGTLL